MPITKIAKLLRAVPSSASQTSSGLDQYKITIAALLFRLVRSDGEAKMLELIHMSELLRKQFSMSQAELENLFKLADTAYGEGTDSEQMVIDVASDMDLVSRMELLEYLWVLAFVDDHLDDAEIAKIESVAKLLRLTPVQQAQAQENAELHLGL